MTAILDNRVSTDPSAWLETHGDYLYRYAMFRLRNATAAEDAVQETLLAALQASNRYQGSSSERTWLVEILKHKIIDHYRRIGRAREVRAFDLGEDEYDPFERSGEWEGHWREDMAPTDWHLDASATLEKKEFWETLDRCLSDLPQRTALAFTMREIDGLSSEEVCDVLDLSRNNLWVLLHRARLQLRYSLEAAWVRGEPPKVKRVSRRRTDQSQTMTFVGFERLLKRAQARLRVPVRFPGLLRLIGWSE
jgi:RNA polymerase sigma-70 factor (TIGR02943 family)